MEQNKFVIWVSSINVDDNWINAEFYRPEVVDIEERFIDNININIFKLNQIAKVNRVTGFEVEKHLRIVEKGIPYLRVKNVNECYLNFEDMQFIPNDVHEKFNKSQFKTNDIALTITGRVGTAAIIPENMECNACQDVVKISLKENIKLDPYYLTGYLNTRYNYKLLNRFNSGGSRPRTLINNVREVSIPIPSPQIQKYIGDKFRKAEELREGAKRLKKEAEEILNEKLNINELLSKIEKYKDKYNWTNSLDIDDRMDALNYNPQKTLIKKFYKNYKLYQLNKLVDYKKGYAFKSEDYRNDNTGTLLFRVSDISNNEVNTESMIRLPNEFYQDYLDFNLVNEDIVMVVTGNTTGKSIIINNSKSNLVLNQNAIRMRSKDSVDVSPYYIELILQSCYFQILLKYSLFQSVQPFISMEFLNDINIPIIEKREIDDIANRYKSSLDNLCIVKSLVSEAKQDIEDLIEGNFDMSKTKGSN